MPFFQDIDLQPTTRNVLATMEITEPTAIQAEAIPALLAGRDLVGQSATGSGKTLAYGIPLVERISKNTRTVQALVLVPTRELAVQVHAVLGKLATSRRLATAVLVGGRPYNSQNSALRYGAQIVVGTPGRVKDHLERGTLELSHLRMCVLDEADQMLDIGFAPVIEEILATTPETRQMAFFSATMPDWVVQLQEKFLKNPVTVAITPATGAQSTIEQIAYQVPHDQKMAALCTLLHSTEGESSLIFGKTKFGVEKLGKQLNKLGFTVGTLHGDKSQRAREEVLSAFRRGQVQTLLATNVAARGLDIQGIYQVINYELPESSELFTHRIGRTGRMGHQGKAITLLVPSDVPKWRRMARNLGQAVELQRLTLNAEAMLARPVTQTEMTDTQESEQRDARQSIQKGASVPQEQPREERRADLEQMPSSQNQRRNERQSNRGHISSIQGRGRDNDRRSRQESRTASRAIEQEKTRRSETKPAWQSEDTAPAERPFYENGKKGTSKHARVTRAMTKHKTHPFTTTESEYQRTSRGTSEARTQRASATSRRSKAAWR